MRKSMLALIDKGETHAAHPAFWAPFVVWARWQQQGIGNSAIAGGSGKFLRVPVCPNRGQKGGLESSATSKLKPKDRTLDRAFTVLAAKAE